MTNNLGVLLVERNDLEEAETWLYKAAGAGNSHAMLNLGIYLAGGLAHQEAVTWLRKAAGAGNVKARHRLVAMLSNRGDKASEDEQ